MQFSGGLAWRSLHPCHGSKHHIRSQLLGALAGKAQTFGRTLQSRHVKHVGGFGTGVHCRSSMNWKHKAMQFYGRVCFATEVPSFRRPDVSGQLQDSWCETV